MHRLLLVVSMASHLVAMVAGMRAIVLLYKRMKRAQASNRPPQADIGYAVSEFWNAVTGKVGDADGAHSTPWTESIPVFYWTSVASAIVYVTLSLL